MPGLDRCLTMGSVFGLIEPMWVLCHVLEASALRFMYEIESSSVALLPTSIPHTVFIHGCSDRHDLTLVLSLAIARTLR